MRRTRVAVARLASLSFIRFVTPFLLVIVFLVGLLSRAPLQALQTKIADVRATVGGSPRFGFQTVQSPFNFDQAAQVGGLYQVVGKATSWGASTNEGGVGLDTATLVQNIDLQICQADIRGIHEFVLRVRPGGGAGLPFKGDQSTWPVDTAVYEGEKNGEWLGPFGSRSETFTSYPPKDAASRQLWYQFVRDLVTRYTADAGLRPRCPSPHQDRPVPFVRYWATIEEADDKAYWYGTSAELTGDSDGVIPTFYRAVKDSTGISTKVIVGGFSSALVGDRIAFEMGTQRGGKYDSPVRQFLKEYFLQNRIVTDITYGYYLNNKPEGEPYDTEFYDRVAADQEKARSWNIEDAVVAASASYDVLAIHSYDFWSKQDDVISFYRARNAASRPVWFTEIGVGISTVPDAQPRLLEAYGDGRDIYGLSAEWTFKKLVIALAEGADQVSYAPFQDFVEGVMTYPGLYEMGLSNPPPTDIRSAFVLVSRTLATDRGYAGAGRREAGPGSTRIIRFESSTGERVTTVWDDEEAGTRLSEVAAQLGISTDRYVVADYMGRPVAKADDPVITPHPVLLRWGPSVVDADGDDYSPDQGYPLGWDCNDADAAVGACAVDSDLDGVMDTTDNCPSTPNPGQEDADGDGKGDACDPYPNNVCAAVPPSAAAAAPGMREMLAFVFPGLSLAYLKLLRSARSRRGRRER